MDLFSRKIVGWAMRDHLRTELAATVLMMAVRRQRLAAGLIHHSDRGVQYAWHDYRSKPSSSSPSIRWPTPSVTSSPSSRASQSRITTPICLCR
jgi:hypothetical protein